MTAACRTGKCQELYMLFAKKNSCLVGEMNGNLMKYKPSIPKHLSAHTGANLANLMRHMNK